MMDSVREVHPNAKLVYNNSPSFNWTLNFHQQAYDAMAAARSRCISIRPCKPNECEYDETELSASADEDSCIPSGRISRSRYLPPLDYSTDTTQQHCLPTTLQKKEYFGDQGMLGYVTNVQRKEIRQGIACVKHQNMSGSDMGDDHKEYFAGENALKAAGRQLRLINLINR